MTMAAPSRPAAPAARRFRSRPLVALLLVGSLLAAGVMRAVVADRREKVIYANGLKSRSASRLAGLDTFALGLILGGLRGPLVMILWSKSENAKNARDLESVDTQIELIRMLQPEFDSVHIFQMWNKAYNISVQMASLPNKYATILDAIDYGTSVDRERPDNVNILGSLGDLYANKLGDSAEHRYYSQRMRHETLPHKDVPRIKRGEQGWRRTQHDVVLDERGAILPEHLLARVSLPGYDGSDYEHLARYDTDAMGRFRHGLSPLAAGFNYYKRAGALTAATGQKHLQLSDAVIDSRPGVFLGKWAEEEWELARRNEIKALGLKEHEDRRDNELVAAAVPLGGPFIPDRNEARARVAEALFEYLRAAQVASHAVEEHERHVREQGGADAITYASHISEAIAMRSLALADQQYLALMAQEARLGLDAPEHAYLGVMARAMGLEPAGADPAKAELAKAKARQLYQRAIDDYYRLMLAYYVDDQISIAVYPAVTEKLLGRAYTRAEIAKADPKVYPPLYQTVKQRLAELQKGHSAADMPVDGYLQDRMEYEQNIERAAKRLEMLR